MKEILKFMIKTIYSVSFNHIFQNFFHVSFVHSRLSRKLPCLFGLVCFGFSV